MFVQNGVGDLTIEPAGKVEGLAGDGVIAEISATGSGNIVVDDSVDVTGTGSGSTGMLAENLNAANNGNVTVTQLGGASGGGIAISAVTDGDGNVTVESAGEVTATADQAINAASYGSGDISVTTDAGSTIHSGGSGILVTNLDSAIAASADSTIKVTAYGTINSGTAANPDGHVPQGIVAGYYGTPDVIEGGSGLANTNVNGTVVVNNYADITAAAGYGIDAYNYGNGDVTVNDNVGTLVSGPHASVTGAQYGIAAYALSGGTGDVVVYVGENATITGTSVYGIEAVNFDVGNVCVSTAATDVINSGSTGIDVNDQGNSTLPTATMSLTVTANGTINSGSGLTPQGGAPAGIIAGYSGTGVDDNVTVNSDASIVAAAGAGIDVYNFGIGDVTVTTGTDSSITAPGDSIEASAQGGGNVSVTNKGTASGGIYASAVDAGTVGVSNSGTVSGPTGLFATDQNGDITITNGGQITGTSFSGIDVEQGSAGTTGSSTITNTGTIYSTNSVAITIEENATGTATIDNSGTIGPSVPSTSAEAVFEGGGDIIINNTAEITGSLNLANGSFNNETGGTWNATGSNGFGFLSTTGVVEAFTITNAGTIDLTGATLSDAHGLVIGNSGTIDSVSGENIIHHAAITNTGSFEVFAGSWLTLDLGSTVTNTGNTIAVDGAVTGAVPVAAATLLLEDGASVTSGTLTLGSSSTLDIEHGANGSGATLDGVVVTGTDANTGTDPTTPASTIEVGATSAATLTLDDGVKISGGTLGIGEHGVLDAVYGTAGAAVTLDDISVTNAGLLEVSGGSALHLDASVNNRGTLEANGGTLVIGADAGISGNASVTITDGGLADFVGISTQAQPQTLMLNASFSGSGTLELDDSQH